MNRDQHVIEVIERNRLVRDLFIVFADLLAATDVTFQLPDKQFPIDPDVLQKSIGPRIQVFYSMYKLIQQISPKPPHIQLRLPL